MAMLSDHCSLISLGTMTSTFSTTSFLSSSTGSGAGSLLQERAPKLIVRRSNMSLTFSLMHYWFLGMLSSQ